ncbi:MAG: hypothetical protein PHY09_03680 [Desulfuromonadaceae bacterium]|nr:hypothetical protein [Desulfuromonadaceae bacterium]MDD5104150.1 hypothetical protein [Desulfuromonadaceae bacterium]
MSNLLIITDVARLRKIFGRLTEDKNIRLRIVNNLEKGGEEIAIEKPDVVFVQTHLSGLSADILLMHLKKQLGRRRSRFVLLASPGQVTDAILKPYHGWLDTSAEDGQLLYNLQSLLDTLLNKPKKGDATTTAQSIATVPTPESINIHDTPSAPVALSQPEDPGHELMTTIPAIPEPSLEEQGVTYAPRQRLKVYSEFNSSFDNAVSRTPEPEPVEQTTPSQIHDWSSEHIDSIETTPVRSKNITFLLWLAPVVIAVIVITYLQQHKSSTKAKPTSKIETPVAVAKPEAQKPPQSIPVAITTPPQTVIQNQDNVSDKAVLSAIADNRTQKSPVPTASSGASLTTLPDFIPRYGFDKQFGTTNPGWERYKGQVTEFKILREAGAIKAIQGIDRGGEGIPESFMRAVVHQTAKKPALVTDSTEKKDGYQIQRGRIANNIKVVYYRDEDGGKLRAFVLTWQ